MAIRLPQNTRQLERQAFLARPHDSAVNAVSALLSLQIWDGRSPHEVKCEGISEFMVAPSAIDTRRHSCECCCVHCERNGTGYFAQRAALDGDQSAAKHLSPAIYATLAAERASRLPAERTAVSA